MRAISVFGSLMVLAALCFAGPATAQEGVLDVRMRVLDDISHIDAVIIELRASPQPDGEREPADDGARQDRKNSAGRERSDDREPQRDHGNGDRAGEQEAARE